MLGKQFKGRFWTASFLALFLLGCGGDDDRVIDVFGTVNIDGNVVESGKIYFSPNVQAGNSGPMGVAKIKNGKFDTAESAGRGVVGGKYVVRIERNFAFDENISEAAFQRFIASDNLPSFFEFEVEFSRDDRRIEQNFDIDPAP